MGTNIELDSILGRISQLVHYHELNENELNVIKTFCDKMIAELGFIDRAEVFNFKDFKISRQEDVNADYTVRALKNETCPDNSMSDSGEVDSGVILNWRDRYTELDGMQRKYLPSIEISKEVAQELFRDIATTKIKIYLGESKDNALGLEFLTMNENENTYHIISNTPRKKPLSKTEFEDYRMRYDQGLKSILDRYIVHETQDPNSKNTKRFILGRRMYENFIRVCGGTANSVIAFYPVIYLNNDYLQYPDDDDICIKVKHMHRLTFLMTSEHHTEEGRTPFEKESVYDRNGLCPPPDGSNC